MPKWIAHHHAENGQRNMISSSIHMPFPVTRRLSSASILTFRTLNKNSK